MEESFSAKNGLKWDDLKDTKTSGRARQAPKAPPTSFFLETENCIINQNKRELLKRNQTKLYKRKSYELKIHKRNAPFCTKQVRPWEMPESLTFLHWEALILISNLIWLKTTEGDLWMPLQIQKFRSCQESKQKQQKQVSWGWRGMIFQQF